MPSYLETYKTFRDLKVGDIVYVRLGGFIIPNKVAIVPDYEFEPEIKSYITFSYLGYKDNMEEVHGFPEQSSSGNTYTTIKEIVDESSQLMVDGTKMMMDMEATDE